MQAFFLICALITTAIFSVYGLMSVTDRKPWWIIKRVSWFLLLDGYILATSYASYKSYGWGIEWHPAVAFIALVLGGIAAIILVIAMIVFLPGAIFSTVFHWKTAKKSHVHGLIGLTFLFFSIFILHGWLSWLIGLAGIVFLIIALVKRNDKKKGEYKKEVLLGRWYFGTLGAIILILGFITSGWIAGLSGATLLIVALTCG